MEPLSALSIACNILQIIETGSKVLSKAAEYRGASDGTLSEHNDLRTTAQSLHNLNNDLEKTLSKDGSSRSLTVAEQRLVQANEECLRLSKDFINVLSRLKVTNPHAVFETIRTALKSLWYKENIEAMDKSLSRARDNLTLSFLVYMDSKQDNKAIQAEIQKHSSKLEGSILQAMSTSSTLIQDEVKSLSQRIEAMNLDSVQPAFAQFIVEHHQFLDPLSRQIDAICAMHSAVEARKEEADTRETRQRIMGSLDFPQIRDRRDHIRSAYHDTYRWILSDTTTTDTRWDNLVAWFNDPEPQNRIYWINSKPGAGKSSLIRFLEDELDPDLHMRGWIGDMEMIKAHYYFWNPGNTLQKTLAGLLRTILHQLFDGHPHLIQSCVPSRKWNVAQNSNRQDITWTNHELRECLGEVLRTAAASKLNILLLIDGLDEIDGDDDASEDLVDLIRELANYAHIRMCVSSRRWPIFQDAFVSCPQMHLEDLNGPDIKTFVQGQLQSQNRYQQMLDYDPDRANLLVEILSRKAEGVFLWARLVVRELIRGLRDGDSNHVLLQRLHDVPGDLGEYFGRFLESIEPYHRWEASVLLQIALHDEQEFTTLHPLRLIDLMFLDDANTDFALENDVEMYVKDLESAECLFYRLESTLRRLSSRCKGLLECYYHCGWAHDHLDDDEGTIDQTMIYEFVNETWGRGSSYSSVRTVTTLPSTLIPVLRENRHMALDFQVDFMHRSLRDFLLEPEQQRFLCQYTGGPYDARNYIRNVRLTEILMNQRIGFSPHMTLGLASSFICTLSVQNFRNDPRCAQFATKFVPSLAFVRTGYRGRADYWYICSSIREWEDEKSTFLTLAIDFALTGYLIQNLTADAVREKQGRPLLDYALRPRFAWPRRSDLKIANQYPDPGLVRGLLSLGADPNQEYDEMSLWPLFLSFIVKTSKSWSKSQTIRKAYALTLKAMITGGAATTISTSELAESSDRYGWDIDNLAEKKYIKGPGSALEFLEQWCNPTIKVPLGVETAEDVKVPEILEFLKPILGDVIDHLKDLAIQQTASRSDLSI